MDALKRRRQTIKAGLTRLENSFNIIAAIDGTPDENYKIRLRRLEELFQEFNEVQTSIEELVEENQMDLEYEYRELIEEKYYAIYAKCISKVNRSGPNEENIGMQNVPRQVLDMSSTLDVLANNQTQLTAILQNLTSNVVSSTPHNNTSDIQPKLQLPTIQLPTFSGDYKQWQSFNDLFQSLVHNNSNLSPSHKFQYLKLALKGEAGSVLKHLDISDVNYESAYKLLEKKYNKRNYIVESHLQTIMDYPSLKHPSYEGIRNLLNIFEETVNALKALKLPTNQWDSWINFLIISKLDKESEQLWRRESASMENPTLQSLLQFLENRIYELSFVNRQHKRDLVSLQQKSYASPRIKLSHAASLLTCFMCKDNHFLFSCPSFIKLTVNERYNFVKSKGLCFNCIKGKHLVKECKTVSRCQVCEKAHHTLLHYNLIKTNTDKTKISNLLMATQKVNQLKWTGVLPTAIVLVKDCNNDYQKCRILLDSGSELTLVSEQCVQRLGLERKNSRIILVGVGGSETEQAQTSTKGSVNIEIMSRFNDSTLQTTAYILNKLSNIVPSVKLSMEGLQWCRDLEQLADSDFYIPSKIDIILGCDMFFESFLHNKITSSSSNLIACETIFGWVITGKTTETTNAICYHSAIDIDATLRQFWEIEEIKGKTDLTENELECEHHFSKTHERLPNGQYMVRLPFKESKKLLGNTKQGALSRLRSIERRLKSDQEFSKYYDEFMEDYLKLNHMSKINCVEKDAESDEGYYLPHHGVWKESSSSTKLRVVFDGSFPSSTGVSLNDILHIGVKIHNDLYSILLKFRKGKIGYSADIQKMFRQILIHPSDRKYQKIIWRNANTNEYEEYELNTVTYGTSCAPFLSLRVLQQLCIDEELDYSRGAHLLKNSFYVDDLLSSDDTIEEALIKRDEIINILLKGNFILHKWASNNEQFLESISEDQQRDNSILTLNDDTVVKTLGLNWHTREDVFSYKVNIEVKDVFSKRTILSVISRIFDPMGLLAPCIILAKILLQQLWMTTLSWDASLPNCITERWKILYEQLPELENLKVPRWINLKRNLKYQIHGFADASEQAYAAAIYIRVCCKDEIIVHLLTAKTKVAPIKQLSIPRLELCAAYLLAKLFIQVKSAFQSDAIECFAWTDSTVVLAWLNDHPRRWTTFVGNRTSFILNVIPSQGWRHVRSNLNPADHASRGLLPKSLLACDLWWRGPDFLKDSSIDFSHNDGTFNTDVEQRKLKLIATTQRNENEFLNKFSSLTRLLRITCWLMRFINKCRRVKLETEFINTRELNVALLIWIKFTQHQTFSDDILSIKNNKCISAKGKLLALEPFLDNKDILRVGGRLENANISHDQRHPIILDKDDRLSYLIVAHYHNKLLHAQGQLLESTIRLKYWIIGLKYLIKRYVRQCVICIRHKAEVATQKMAALPASRFKTGKPFLNTGIDYAGPLSVRTWKGRGAKIQKCYISLFICMSTKAIHLELVMDLSTESFIAAFKRFISRRGTVNIIYSDNGTNFQGAVRHLKEVYEFFKSKDNSSNIQHYLSENNISWKFIPPSAPHFGGLWEAGVRSVKFHLKRVLSNANLTYDELNTLLCQIEFCLNSRPLMPLSNNIEDLETLTPGHFLTGDALMCAPEIPISDDVKCLKTRWQYVQKIQQGFWRKWSNEYLSNLQQKSKWLIDKRNIQVNDLVLIADSNLPPGKWLMGRVHEVHPGKDNLVRVTTLKTKSGMLKRPISKLCILLPYEDENKCN